MQPEDTAPLPSLINGMPGIERKLPIDDFVPAQKKNDGVRRCRSCE
jgi:hypothetical protein